MEANHLKAAGYLVSTLSALLLGAVAWASADGDDMLRLAVIVGPLSAIAGMFMRWLSYQEERDTSVPSRTKRA